jgi:hypothetical protein
MQRMTRRLSAVLVSTFVALGLTTGIAGATSGHPEPKRGDHAEVSQVLRQESDTHQYAKSKAKSFQLIPVNLNAPVSGGVLEHGKSGPKGGSNDDYGKGRPDRGCQRCGDWTDDRKPKDSHPDDVKQTNDASAESEAKNEAFTGQVAYQHQDVEAAPGSGGSYQSPKCGCGDPWKHDDGTDVSQRLEQDADTRQKAESEATSHQFVPVNVNLPISVLSHGSNGGDVKQTNDASAESEAKNEAFTGQAAYQDQDVTSSPSNGADEGGDVAQSGSQDSDTSQKAESKAESYQVVPINVNAPISVLSHGSNNGDVHQTNDASTDSSARNSAGTLQLAGQSQQISTT